MFGLLALTYLLVLGPTALVARVFWRRGLRPGAGPDAASYFVPARGYDLQGPEAGRAS